VCVSVCLMDGILYYYADELHVCVKVLLSIDYGVTVFIASTAAELTKVIN
jgi:hypothetical protein